MVGVALLSLFQFNAVTAVAGTQGSCGASDPTKVRLWENAITDTGDGDDSLWVCSNTANLGNISHTLQGDCKGAFVGQGNWNDCVNSYSNTGHWCFFNDANYGSYMDERAGTGRFNLIQGDSLSSVHIGTQIWGACNGS